MELFLQDVKQHNGHMRFIFISQFGTGNYTDPLQIM
jgi:hypothetical protein